MQELRIMRADIKDTLHRKISSMDKIPTLPTMALLLLHYIDKPLDNLLLPWVVELIGQDETAAAECIKMANSALSARRVTTVQAAVMALGLQRVRDITVSSCGKGIMPISGPQLLDPSTFWQHCLACALITKKLAQKVGFRDVERAYIAGLFHDLGILAHWWLIPAEFEQAIQRSRSEAIPLHQAESEWLGLDHTETGADLGHRWNLGADVIDVIRFHHRVNDAREHRALVALVSLGDGLCRESGLGYGLNEAPSNIATQPAVMVLKETWPNARILDESRGRVELNAYLEEVRKSVMTFSSTQ
jgi:putative nucleotidyltransferase with HDIG domain